MLSSKRLSTASIAARCNRCRRRVLELHVMNGMVLISVSSGPKMRIGRATPRLGCGLAGRLGDVGRANAIKRLVG